MKIAELLETVIDASTRFGKKPEVPPPVINKISDKTKYTLELLKNKVKAISDNRTSAMFKYRIELAPLFRSYKRSEDFFDVLAEALTKDENERKLAERFIEKYKDEILSNLQESYHKFFELTQDVHGSNMSPPMKEMFIINSGLSYAARQTSYLLWFFKDYISKNIN